MSTDQASHSVERGPARKQLSQPPWARAAFGLFAVFGLYFAFSELQSGSFTLAMVMGYSAITCAAFALNIKARFSLLLIGGIFLAAYVYHLSAAK